MLCHSHSHLQNLKLAHITLCHISPQDRQQIRRKRLKAGQKSKSVFHFIFENTVFIV